jgi:glycosyltransferase involved in cell wall biosynthesis
VKVVAVSWRDLANPLAGGAEVLIDRLLRSLQERGHEVALVCGGPVARRGYPVVQAGGTYSQYLRAPLVCAARWRNADIVIDVENGLPYFSPLWRRQPSVCLMHHVHTDQWGMQFPRPVAAIGRVLESHVMPRVYRARIFVAVSASTAAALHQIGVPRDHIRVVESGVDVPQGVLSPKTAQPSYLSISRVVPHKRLHLILEAWKFASQKIDGTLVIAGDGPGLGALRRQASTIPRVQVLGRVDEREKSRLLAQSWCIISAAHHEGWGMSVMEAAAHGTPSLAIDAPGIRDAVVDGKTGVLVPGGHDGLPRSLADAWVTMASAASDRARMGAAARAWASQFTWDRTTDRWLDVLEHAASGGRRVHASTAPPRAAP